MFKPVFMLTLWSALAMAVTSVSAVTLEEIYLNAPQGIQRPKGQAVEPQKPIIKRPEPAQVTPLHLPTMAQPAMAQPHLPIQGSAPMAQPVPIAAAPTQVLQPSMNDLRSMEAVKPADDSAPAAMAPVQPVAPVLSGPDEAPEEPENPVAEGVAEELLQQAVVGPDGSLSLPEVVEAAQPVSMTEPTMDELPQAAEHALELGLLKRAAKFYQQLEATQPDLAKFGQAKVLTAQGHYAEALKILDTLYRDGSYHYAASELRAGVLLTLAEIAQHDGNTADAELYLRDYLSNHKGMADQARFEHLMRTQNRLTHNETVTNANQPLRMALLVPLSGDLAAAGQDLQRAAMMALFEQPLPNLELLPIDTQGTPAGAQAAAQQAIVQGTDVILGPLLATSVEAVTPLAHAAGRPVIAFSSDAKVAGPSTFLMSYVPTEQARMMARHAVSEGKTTFAALIPDTTYGHEMLKAFSAELATLGVKLVRSVFYKPDTVDLSKPLRELVRMDESEKVIAVEKVALEKEYKKLGGAMEDAKLARLKELRKAKAQPMVDYEALYVPASAEAMPLIAPQLAFYDTDTAKVMVLGSALWNSPALYQNKAEYLRGAHYPAPDRAGTVQFEKAFRDAYGVMPHVLAPLAYDAVHVVSELVEDGFNSDAEIPARLQRTGGFSGATGAFNFTAEGLPHRAYDILEVTSKGPEVVEAAPSFMPPALPNNNGSYREQDTGSDWSSFVPFFKGFRWSDN